MRTVRDISMLVKSLITLSSLVVLNLGFVNYAEGSASSENGGKSPAGGDGNCTVEVVVQTTPKFTERLPCQYSNYPVPQSDHLIWKTSKNAAGFTVNLLTGKPTADSATVDLHNDNIPYIDGNGNTVTIPKIAYVYDLNSTSKNAWSGVVDVFTTSNDPTPVECQGGYYGRALPSIPYVTGSTLQLRWATVNDAGDVVHGTARALLSCAKINLRGQKTPLGMIGTAVINF